jgi:hypothetical protein
VSGRYGSRTKSVDNPVGLDKVVPPTDRTVERIPTTTGRNEEVNDAVDGGGDWIYKGIEGVGA